MDLSPNHFQKLYAYLSDKGKSQHAIHTVNKILNTILRQAEKMNAIPKNPLKGVDSPARPNPRMSFLDEAQVQTLLLTASFLKNRYRMLYNLAIHTGMRQAELLGLKWEDIDLEGKSISVTRQLIRKRRGGYELRQPKTISGLRKLAIGETVVKGLREHWGEQQEIRKMVDGKWKDLNITFPSKIGTPIVASNLRNDFRNLLRVAGLPKVRFHDLRHTSASLMLNYGIPAIVVSKRLGHANPSITLNVYGHVMPSMQEKAAETMDELLTPANFPIALKLHPK